MNCTEAQTSILISGKYSCIDAPWKCTLKYPQAGTDISWMVDNVTKLCTIVPSPSPSPFHSTAVTNTTITNTTTNSSGLTCLTGYKKLCTSPAFAGLSGSCICIPFDSSSDNTTNQPYVDLNTRTAKEGVNCENAFYCFFTDTLPYALISVFSAALLLGCLLYCLRRYCCPGWNPCRTCCYRCGCYRKNRCCGRRNHSKQSSNRSYCCVFSKDHSSTSHHGSHYHQHRRNSSYPIEKQDRTAYRTTTKGKKQDYSGAHSTKGSILNFKPSLDMESTDTLSLAEILSRAIHDHSYPPNNGSSTALRRIIPNEPIILQLPSTKDGKISPRYIPMSPWRNNPLYGTLGNTKELHHSFPRSVMVPEFFSSTLSPMNPSLSIPTVSLQRNPPMQVYRENIHVSVPSKHASKQHQHPHRPFNYTGGNAASLPTNNEVLLQTILSLKNSIKNKTLTSQDIEQILRQTLPTEYTRNIFHPPSPRSSQYTETERSNCTSPSIPSKTDTSRSGERNTDTGGIDDVPPTPRYVTTDNYNIPRYPPSSNQRNHYSTDSSPINRSTNNTVSPASSSPVSNHASGTNRRRSNYPPHTTRTNRDNNNPSPPPSSPSIRRYHHRRSSA